ncbi:MAG: EF-P beta-lysylation protein EpmB [Chromatiales bacterium]|jgi:EF-P beta-lysylation protein EpmB
MIARSPRAVQAPPWQRLLSEGFSRPAALLEFLDLDPALLAPAEDAARAFPLRVPRGYAARMRRGDPADPLLRQVLPLGLELDEVPGFGADPVGDLGAVAAPGVLHKYRGRALLVVTGACAVHCRYCFRRHYPYPAESLRGPEAGTAIAWLRRSTDIREVILSGGDPLVLSDRRLAGLARALADIPHLQRLRIHTRLPVVLPERIDASLLEWLAHGRLKPVVVVHANHPRELDEDVAAALGRLKDAGVELLNQAVLLAGVNDSAEVLAELSERLFEHGVLPYYLHGLDRVRGAAHFEVPDGRALALQRELSDRLPGYLVPRLVREVPGAASKLPLDAC